MCARGYTTIRTCSAVHGPRSFRNALSNPRAANSGAPAGVQPAQSGAELAVQWKQASSTRQPSHVKASNKRHQAEVTANTRLQRVAAVVPGLGPGSRVLHVGPGAEALIPCFQERGIMDILVVGRAEVIANVHEQHPTTTLGNTKGVRTWLGDVNSIPAYQGPFDAVFFDDAFHDTEDQRGALLSAALLLKPGGCVALSHLLSSQWQQDMQESEPKTVHESPPLAELIADLPLHIQSSREEDASDCAVLQVPVGYSFDRAPIMLDEEVVSGFGRGSKQMGIPTANLRPDSLFSGPLDGLPLGVYFGWAQLQGIEGVDGDVQKTVLNIGRRPTVEDGEQRTVELHILHKFTEDFYGQRMKAVVVGFIRPEMKFTGLEALVKRIKADVGIAKTQLDLPQHADLKKHRLSD